MRRVGDLWPRVSSFSALHAAYLRARRGKRFSREALAFEAEREDNLRRLRDELGAGTYRPGAYRTFTLYDPKPRVISAAPFRDRVVHHAIHATLEPVFDPTFVRECYANRKGKGTHAALRRFRAWCRTYPYVLRCDVAKFFPSVDHDILKALLRRKVKDGRVLALCDLVIESPGGEHGMPIGNLTSQLFQNVYLSPLDHFAKEQLRCRAYLRFVDDFALFAHDTATLRRWRTEVFSCLGGLHLRPNTRTFEISPTADGANWLGFFVTPDDCRIARSRRVSFRRRLWRRWRDRVRGRISAAELTASVRSWVAHAAHGRTAGLRRHLLSRCPPCALRWWKRCSS
jgi:retron-type reverse transcriptase